MDATYTTVHVMQIIVYLQYVIVCPCKTRFPDFFVF